MILYGECGHEYRLPFSSPPSPPFLRRRYPFFQYEGDRDSLSSQDSEEGLHDRHSHLMRLLEDLDRRRSQERPRRHQQDDELQRALEISQQEYDDQKRLNAGRHGQFVITKTSGVVYISPLLIVHSVGLIP